MLQYVDSVPGCLLNRKPLRHPSQCEPQYADAYIRDEIAV